MIYKFIGRDNSGRIAMVSYDASWESPEYAKCKIMRSAPYREHPGYAYLDLCFINS